MNALDDLGDVARMRSSFGRARAALAKGHLTLGFLGGSITDARTRTRWPEPFAAWLVDAYPGVRLSIENAAIGATGSDLAVFRTQRDIVARGCDLVFLEYSVNDFDQPTQRRQRTREGVLRQLLRDPRDVVIVHAFRQEMLADMRKGIVPASIAEFEELAEHYGLSSIWMGLHALREVDRGLMTWQEWLPDGLHPEHRGSLSYAQSLIAYCSAELSPSAASTPRPATLPPSLHSGAWELVGFVPFADVNLIGPWTVRRWVAHSWIDQALHTTAPGARLRCTFEGRGFVIGFDFGAASGEVRYRVDDGPWQSTCRERPGWVGEAGWFRPTVVADDLSSGRHTFELETLHGGSGGRSGTETAIGFLGVIR